MTRNLSPVSKCRLSDCSFAHLYCLKFDKNDSNVALSLQIAKLALVKHRFSVKLVELVELSWLADGDSQVDVLASFASLAS